MTKKAVLTKETFPYGADVSFLFLSQTGNPVIIPKQGLPPFKVFWNFRPDYPFLDSSNSQLFDEAIKVEQYFVLWNRLGAFPLPNSPEKLAVCGPYSLRVVLQDDAGKPYEDIIPFFISDQYLKCFKAVANVLTKRLSGLMTGGVSEMCELDPTSQLPALNIVKGILYAVTWNTTVYDHIKNDPPDLDDYQNPAEFQNTREKYYGHFVGLIGEEALNADVIDSLFLLGDYMHFLLRIVEKQQGAEQQNDNEEQRRHSDYFRKYAAEAVEVAHSASRHLSEASRDWTTSPNSHDIVKSTVWDIIDEASQPSLDAFDWAREDIYCLFSEDVKNVEQTVPKYAAAIASIQLEDLARTLIALSEQWGPESTSDPSSTPPVTGGGGTEEPEPAEKPESVLEPVPEDKYAIHAKEKLSETVLG